MKVSLYKRAKKEAREYKLKLFEYKDKIVLALANEDGDRIESSGLIAITQDMILVRCIHIDESLGLPLDENGHLSLGEKN